MWLCYYQVDYSFIYLIYIWQESHKNFVTYVGFYTDNEKVHRIDIKLPNGLELFRCKSFAEIFKPKSAVHETLRCNINTHTRTFSYTLCTCFGCLICILYTLHSRITFVVSFFLFLPWTSLPQWQSKINVPIGTFLSTAGCQVGEEKKEDN